MRCSIVMVLYGIQKYNYTVTNVSRNKIVNIYLHSKFSETTKSGKTWKSMRVLRKCSA